MIVRRSYVALIYDSRVRQVTRYPDHLVAYLIHRYGITTQQRVLDLGCGRGDFLAAFRRLGIQVSGVDCDVLPSRYHPDVDVRLSDLDQDGIPFDANTFDVVLCKSVISHVCQPERLVAETYRVLKPGGLAIILTPDWAANYKMFYEDFTHRQPFSVPSLRDIYRIYAFDDVKVERFRQLPILWRYPYLLPCSWMAAWFPRWTGRFSTFIRFSQELMLLGTGRKHTGTETSDAPR